MADNKTQCSMWAKAHFYEGMALMWVWVRQKLSASKEATLPGSRKYEFVFWQ